MEDKHGMVAVVESRRDAGLTVTLIGRGQAHCTNASHPKALASTAVDTGTGRHGMRNTGAQICDDRYISSYQLSHCNACPSSPPVLASEFPRQTKLSRTQGNFDISGCGSYGSSCFKMKASGSPLTSPDRGTDPFVKSLRQYPSVPEGDSLSSDVIQRLIVYTQVSKSSCHTKSMRNLRIRNLKGQSGLNSQIQNTSKGVQTYTRATRNSKERDVDVETKRREGPWFASRIPENPRDIKNNCLDDVYDYLSASPGILGDQTRSSEVRYLGDIARRVGKTFREIYKDRREVCPHIEERYNRHRQDHHRESFGVETNLETNRQENEEPAKMASAEVVQTRARCQPCSDACTSTSQSPKICCYCKQRMPCKCPRPTTQIHKFSNETDITLPETSSTHPYKAGNKNNDVLLRQIEEEVFGWLDDIPVSAKHTTEYKNKREELAKLLIDKLNIVKRDQYFEENARNEILECLNNMPMWYPGNKSDEQTLKAHIVNNLLYKIPKIPNDNNDDTTINTTKIEKEIEAKILDWLQGIHQYVNFKKKLKEIYKLTQPLVKKLIHLQKHGMYDIEVQRKMQDAINYWLEDNVPSNLDPSALHKLSDKLLVSLLDCFDKNNDNELISEVIKWLNKSKPQLGEDLANKLHEINTKGESHSKTQIKALTCVADYLNDHHENLEDKRLNDFRKELKILLNKRKNSSCRKLIDKFSNFLENSTLSNVYLNENKNLIYHCVSKIEELRNKNESTCGSGIADEISKLVIKLNENSVNKMTSKSKTILVKELTNLVIPENADNRSDKKINGQYENSIHKVVRHILNEFGLSQDISSELENKIESTFLENIGKDEMKNYKQNTVTQIVDFLSNNKDMETKQISEIAEKIANQLMLINPEHPYMFLASKESLKKQENSSLSNSSVQSSYKNVNESTVCDVLADEIMRNDNSETANDENFVLKPIFVSTEESEQPTNELFNKGRNVSLSYKTNIPSFKETQNKNLVDSVYRKILEFTQQLEGDFDIILVSNWESAIQKFAEQVLNIKQLAQSPLDEKNRLKKEVMKYFQKINVNSESEANKLINLLQHLSFKTSTPRSSYDEEFSFNHEQSSTYPDISSIIADSSFVSPYQKNINTNNEDAYRLQVMNKIDDWMLSLPTDAGAEEMSNIKEAMVKDLADEIIERQKYLQLNYAAKTSAAEELEYLRYQIFRWLEKSPYIKQLLTSKAKTNELMNQIKDVPVPQLVKIKKHDKETQLKVEPKRKLIENEGENHTRKSVPNNENTEVIVDEWITSLFVDTGHLSSVRKELKEVVHSSARYDLKEKIKKCLQRHHIPLKDRVLLDQNVNALCERLNNRNIHSRTQPTIDPILSDIINDWARHLPFQIGESCDSIKKDIESFIAKIKEVIETSTLNNLRKVKTEIKKQTSEFLKTLPILISQTNQSHVLDLISKILELVNTILSQERQVSTKPLSRISGGNFYDDIKNWCNTLPIPNGKDFYEQENNNILKQNIASKIMNKIAKLNMKPEIFNDDILYLDLISDEIDDALNELPISNEIENKRKVLKQNLIDKVKVAKQETESDLAGHAYKQKLRQVISNTLPSGQNLSKDEQVPFEILKERLADAFINLNYSEHNENLKNNFRKEISDAISRYCNDYLKRYPALPIDPVILNRELYHALKKVPTPKNETIKAQVEQLRIKTKIYNWLKTLALKKESPIEQLQKTKLISILAKDLHDLTKAKRIDDHNDINKKMKQNITKWVKKLSLQTRAENVIDELSEKLMNDLKFSEDNLKNNRDLEKRTDNIAQSDSSTTYTSPNNDRLSKYKPPASLTREERQHLEKIKQRSQPYSYPLQKSKGISVSIEDISADILQHSYPHAGGEKTVSTKEPISPNIIVNEYNWDNTETFSSHNDENEGQSQISNHVIHSSHPNTTQQSDRMGGHLLKPTWKSIPLTPQVVPKTFIPHVLAESRPAQADAESSPPNTLYQTIPQMNSHSLHSPPSSSHEIARTNNQRNKTGESQTLTKVPTTFEPQKQVNSTPPRVYDESSAHQTYQPITAAQPYDKHSSRKTRHKIKPQLNSHPLHSPPSSSHEISRTNSLKNISRESQTISQAPGILKQQKLTSSLILHNHDVSSSVQTSYPPVTKMDSYTSPRPELDPQHKTKPSQTNSTVPSPPPTRTNHTGQHDMDTNITPENHHIPTLATSDRGNSGMKSFGDQSSKRRRQNGFTEDGSDWTMSFPEHTDLWEPTGSCKKPLGRVCIPSANDKIIKENATERIKCRCKERVLGKCMSKQSRETNQTMYQTDNSIQNCSKCCGARYCPHPSYLYFK